MSWSCRLGNTKCSFWLVTYVHLVGTKRTTWVVRTMTCVKGGDTRRQDFFDHTRSIGYKQVQIKRYPTGGIRNTGVMIIANIKQYTTGIEESCCGYFFGSSIATIVVFVAEQQHTVEGLSFCCCCSLLLVASSWWNDQQESWLLCCAGWSRYGLWPTPLGCHKRCSRHRLSNRQQNRRRCRK